MGTNSKIEWTSHTFNPWRGCTKVSAGCTHCYAEVMSKRNPAVLGVWGRHGARAVAAESYWRLPLAWNKAAARAGERRRVFCASLADVFEGEDTMPAESWPLVQQARARLFELIGSTIHLDWLLLTKRPENILRMLPGNWGGNTLLNMWIGTSVENQAAADERIPHLLRVPARVRFLSMEPLLGAVDLSRWLANVPDLPPNLPSDVVWGLSAPINLGLHWIIVGGESGPNARPMHPDWARALRDQAQAAGASFFFKQWGEDIPKGQQMADGMESLMYAAGSEAFGGKAPRRPAEWDDRNWAYRVGKARAGRLLDGREWNEVPQ